MHIVKWKMQENQHLHSWTRTIRNALREIREIQESMPSITNELIRGYWDKAFLEARIDEEDEMEQKTTIDNLTWQEVFDAEYALLFS